MKARWSSLDRTHIETIDTTSQTEWIKVHFNCALSLSLSEKLAIRIAIALGLCDVQEQWVRSRPAARNMRNARQMSRGSVAHHSNGVSEMKILNSKKVLLLCGIKLGSSRNGLSALVRLVTPGMFVIYELKLVWIEKKPAKKFLLTVRCFAPQQNDASFFELNHTFQRSHLCWFQAIILSFQTVIVSTHCNLSSSTSD